MKSFKMSLFKPGIFLLIFIAGSVFVSCNKALPVEEPAEIPELNPGSTQTIGQMLASSSSYTIYTAMLERVGLLPELQSPGTEWTVFAPTDEAFQTFLGIPDAEAVESLPIENVAGIASYSIIPGKQFLSTDISDNFPNEQLPTALKITDLPGTFLPFPLTIFPSRQNGFWVNNLPIVKADEKFSNGVVHTPLAIVAPPGMLLESAVEADPNLNYFRAAMAYANEGLPDDVRLDSILANPGINTTLFAPSDGAIIEMLVGFYILGLQDSGLPPDQIQSTAVQMVMAKGTSIFEDPDFQEVASPSMVYSVLAYHILTSKQSDGKFLPLFQRIFSNNVTSTVSVTTLVNSSVANHPGVKITPAITGGQVTGLEIEGAKMLIQAFVPAAALSALDLGPASVIPQNGSLQTNAVNGTYYIINHILLP